MSDEQRLTVIGAGTMGQGIAYVAATAGYTVTMTDVSDDAIAMGRRRVEQSLHTGVERGKITETRRDAALAHLRTMSDMTEAVADADIVIEAAPESLSLKQQLFATIEVAAPAHALLATNTSSLSITEIARPLNTAHRLVGMHFFNPVHAMKLIEIVRGTHTSETTITRAIAFATVLGKTPIVVRDTPGFATSRLGVVLGLEAMRMLEQGVASAQDIDRAMELGYNHPVGPLKLTDIVGLDIRLAIADHLHETLGGTTYAAPEILRRYVAEGKLGKKSGEGFYTWNETGDDARSKAPR